MAITSVSESGNFTETFVLEKGKVRYCHIKLQELDKPVAGIEYKGQFYSFFKFCSDWATAEKVAKRLSDPYIVTATPKGWVIWAHEY